MNYFVTCATGFIVRHLVPFLLERGGTVHALVRRESREKLNELSKRWGASAGRVVAVTGDLSRPGLGVSEAMRTRLEG